MIYFILFLYEAFICYFYDVMQMNQKRIFEIRQYKLRIFGKKGFFALAIIIPLWLVMGLRYNIGTDYKAYERIFQIALRYKRNSYHMEQGYYFLNRFAGILSQNPQIIFLVVSFLIVVVFFKGVEKNNASMYYSVLLFLGLGYYFYAMNIQRQYIAIMIVFYAIYFMEKKKTLEFVICVLIAVSFHFSAIIWIFVYFAVNYIPPKFFYIGSAIMALLVNRFYTYVLSVLSKIGFYTGQINKNENFFRMRISISNVIMLAVIMACGIIFNKQLKRHEKNLMRFRPVWLAFLIYSLLYTFGNAATRIATYMCPMNFLVISDIVDCFDVHTKHWIRILVTTVLMILMYIIVAYLGESNTYLPYQYRLL